MFLGTFMPISNPSVSQPPINISFPNTKSVNYNSITKIVSNQWLEIVSANDNRQALTIFNRGLLAVFVDIFSTELQNYMMRLEPGAFYEMPSQGIYVGTFYASANTNISSESTTLEIREFLQTSGDSEPL
jgi:hypothetical protein